MSPPASDEALEEVNTFAGLIARGLAVVSPVLGTVPEESCAAEIDGAGASDGTLPESYVVYDETIQDVVIHSARGLVALWLPAEERLRSARRVRSGLDSIWSGPTPALDTRYIHRPLGEPRALLQSFATMLEQWPRRHARQHR